MDLWVKLQSLAHFNINLHFPEMHELILWLYRLCVLQHGGVVALQNIVS